MVENCIGFIKLSWQKPQRKIMPSFGCGFVVVSTSNNQKVQCIFTWKRRKICKTNIKQNKCHYKNKYILWKRVKEIKFKYSIHENTYTCLRSFWLLSTFISYGKTIESRKSGLRIPACSKHISCFHSFYLHASHWYNFLLFQNPMKSFLKTIPYFAAGR